MKQFKQHAIFRYLSRKEGLPIINDNTFQVWKKQPGNLEKYEKALKELSRIESKCDFRVEAKVGTDLKKTEYAINSEEQAIFAIDGNNVLTYYKLEYLEEASKTSNLTIYKILLKEYNAYKKKLDKHDELNSKKEFKAKSNIENLNADINLYEEKIKNLKYKRDMEKSILTDIEQEKEILKKSVDAVLLKIVKPIILL